MNKRRRAFTVAAVSTLLLLSCTQDRFVDRSTLLAEPAAQLRPPNVVELAHVGADRVTTLDGPQAAFEGHVFGTQTSDQDVMAFYDGELRGLGWQRDRLSAFASTAEIIAWGWCKGHMDFRLAIDDQRKAFKPEFYRGQTFVTVFDARIQSRDASLSCPAPSPIPSR